MINISGMKEFQNICKEKLVNWYNTEHEQYVDLVEGASTIKIDTSNVFIVWSCKTLQNYKAILSTTVHGDGIIAEYTYNGDKKELYEDVYKKLSNKCIVE